MNRDRAIFAIAGAAILASRLPFILAGYGVDPDAWRVANAARHIGETGNYVVSRFPGYPVQEIGYSLIYKCQPWVWNMVTALFSVIACLAFMGVLRRLGSRNWVLGGFTLAFTPIIYLNSVNSMDYLWALGFALSALYCASAKRPWAAGILLGLAIGCRITSVIMAVPIAFLLYSGWKNGRRATGIAAVVTALTAGAAFFPVIKTYGLGFFHYYWVPYPSWQTIAERSTIEVWGVLGTLAAFLAVVSLAFGGSDVRVEKRVVLAFVLSIALYIAVFIKLPCEAAYLVPIVPLTILVLATCARRLVLVSFCVLVMLGSVVTVDSGGVSLFLAHDREVRSAKMATAERIATLAAALPERSVLVMGMWEPMILNRLPYHHSKAHFVATIDSPSLKWFRERGYAIYTVPPPGGCTARSVRLQRAP